MIGNQKGTCRRLQNLPKKPKPLIEEPKSKKIPSNISDDSYLANLVIYLINADDEFKLDDEFLVDYIESEKATLLSNRPDYSEVEATMLDKTAEMKKTEIKARKHARKNNLLKIMGLKEETHKRSASIDNEVRDHLLV